MKEFKYAAIFVLIVGSLYPVALQAQTKPVRESIEWLDVWLPNTNDSILPRILLVGNSITRGYYPEVQKALNGRAYVARLTTSKSVGDPGLLAEVALILDYHKFDIIHFNNGLHGWGYTEKQYADAFPAFINTFRKKAPLAKLVWATTTPIRERGNINGFDARTERIKERNKIALNLVMKQKNIRVNDLWEFTVNQPQLFEGGDGTHPNATGYQKLGEKVASALATVIDELGRR